MFSVLIEMMDNVIIAQGTPSSTAVSYLTSVLEKYEL